VEDGAGSRGVDGRLANADRLLVDGDVAGGVDGGLVDADALLDDGAVGVAVDGGADYVDLVTVLGLEAGAVFTFSDVND